MSYHPKMKIALPVAALLGGSFFLALAEDADPPAQAKPSPLVGHWATILTMGRPGPTQITTITINEDGTYHWLEVQMVPKKSEGEDPETSYDLVGAELKHESGWIDLKTGAEKITEANKKLSVESVTWSVSKGKLRWDMDMGNMGGQGMTFSPVD